MVAAAAAAVARRHAVAGSTNRGGPCMHAVITFLAALRCTRPVRLYVYTPVARRARDAHTLHNRVLITRVTGADRF